MLADLDMHTQNCNYSLHCVFWLSGFTISLEIQGGDCSDQLTLICRHDDIRSDPNWIHNGTAAKGGELLASAFPGLTMYSFQNSTEHRVTVTGVDDVTALDGYVFQCVYSILGTPIKSNAVQYSFIPNGQPQLMHVVNVHRMMLCRYMYMPCMCLFLLLTTFVDIVDTSDFHPKLMKVNVFQSFSGSFCTLNNTAAGYTEGIAKYPSCTNQFTVNFTITPAANISSVTTGDVHLYNITNLERCTIYDTFTTSFRGGQLQDTVYAGDSVMISKLCIACFMYCMALQAILVHVHASSYCYLMPLLIITSVAQVLDVQHFPLHSGQYVMKCGRIAKRRNESNNLVEPKFGLKSFCPIF